MLALYLGNPFGNALPRPAETVVKINYDVASAIIRMRVVGIRALAGVDPWPEARGLVYAGGLNANGKAGRAEGAGA